MKKLLSATAAIALLVAGCSTNPTTGVTTITGTNISVMDVQSSAVKICSYLPTASTVVGIIAANNPAVITAEAVAAAICSAVAAGPSASVARKISRAKGSAGIYIPPGLAIQGSYVH